jgi:phenylalanyl-tRNA synthetase beta chain
MTYALSSPEKEAPLGVTGKYVTLANPIHSERGVMRRSVLASVLQVAATNLKQRPGVRLFEIGKVYDPLEGEKLPRETRRLVIVLTGPRTTEHWDSQAAAPAMEFFDLKGIVEALLERLHVEGVTNQATRTTHLHPGQGAEIVVGKSSIGTLGQLHPSLNEAYDLGKKKVYVADLDLDALLEAVPGVHRFRSISPFPPVLEDIALVVDEAMPAAQVASEIRAGGGELLNAVRLFDVYRGPNLPAGKKSLAYALSYQVPDRNLTDKEVAKVRAKIVGRVEKLLGATLRG